MCIRDSTVLEPLDRLALLGQLALQDDGVLFRNLYVTKVLGEGRGDFWGTKQNQTHAVVWGQDKKRPLNPKNSLCSNLQNTLLTPHIPPPPPPPEKEKAIPKPFNFPKRNGTPPQNFKVC